MVFILDPHVQNFIMFLIIANSLVLGIQAGKRYMTEFSLIHSYLQHFIQVFMDPFISCYVPSLPLNINLDLPIIIICSFNLSFSHLFVCLIIHLFLHPFIHLLVGSFLHSCLNLFIHSFTISFIHTLVPF